jgi:SAM-dependent methyltransferase
MPAPTNAQLVLSASQARLLAPQLCRKDPISGDDCSWYHGLWQDLRLLGLAATAEQQADFFRNAFARFSGRSLRLLISGSADYSILEHVLGALPKYQINAQITVVDLCETPLFFNRWYAEQAGCKIKTVQADIFNHRFEKPFDLICSHGFLSQFPPLRRAELVRQWSRLLSPNGTVLLINRVRPGPAGGETKFSEKQGQQFCDLVSQKLQATPALEESDRALILARSVIYVQRLNGYSLPETELTDLFQQTGFRIDDFQIISSGTQKSAFSGPAIPTDAQHACLVASRI